MMVLAGDSAGHVSDDHSDVNSVHILLTSAPSLSLAMQILACAPQECMDTGCTNYMFSKIGIRTCGIDTNAAVGTVFLIQFKASVAHLFRALQLSCPHPGEPQLLVSCQHALI